MTEKDIKKNNCGDDCNHDYDGCDCGDDCSSNTISLEMEDGTTKDFLVLDILEHEGKQYIALAEVDSDEYDIMGMTVVEDSVELSVIEDDEEFNLVAKLFDDHFSQTDEEEED